ncbi:MAG: chorismate-binding protein [Ignavibacteriae bacterium]|nr:chorismate-binding protein [Ignavibacteriota bacterium]
MIPFATFRQLAASYTVIPLVRTLVADTLTPVLTYLTLREEGVPSFILESVEPNEKIGRFSFIGTRPRVILEARNGSVTVRDARGTEEVQGPLFSVIRSILAPHRIAPVQEPHGLLGGLVGYIGYNCVRHIERIPITPAAGEEPDAILGLFGSVVQFDHHRQVMTLMHNVFIDPAAPLEDQYESGKAALSALELRLRRVTAPATPFSCAMDGAGEPDRAGFEQAVLRAKEHITEGDIFQVVLSRRTRSTFTGDLFAVYRSLRIINPSPYLFFLDFGATKLAGSSPEMLIQAHGGTVELLPIAGTRRRGVDEADDKRLELDLLADPKELAEHVMLVDLGRNDVGRVSEYGSVEVPVFKRVDRYSHVMHIVSEVRGRIRPDIDAVGIFESCFPAGTVSGAPKVRAMEIIADLEPFPRGAYAGAVGYFGMDGTMDTCIAIRTVFAHGQTLKLQAGAGIVADSVPSNEYDETVNKARVLMEAIRLASRGLAAPDGQEEGAQ